jgi:hypothetical protein
MVAKKKGNMLGIKGLNKKEKIRQLASYYAKFLKHGFLRDGVEVDVMSTYNTT